MEEAVYKVVPAPGVSNETVESIFSEYWDKQTEIMKLVSDKTLNNLITLLALQGALWHTVADHIHMTENVSIISLRSLRRMTGVGVVYLFLRIMSLGSPDTLQGKVEICDSIPVHEIQNKKLNEFERRIYDRNVAIKEKMKAIQEQPEQLEQPKEQTS